MQASGRRTAAHGNPDGRTPGRKRRLAQERRADDRHRRLASGWHPADTGATPTDAGTGTPDTGTDTGGRTERRAAADGHRRLAHTGGGIRGRPTGGRRTERTLEDGRHPRGGWQASTDRAATTDTGAQERRTDDRHRRRRRAADTRPADTGGTHTGRRTDATPDTDRAADASGGWRKRRTAADTGRRRTPDGGGQSDGSGIRTARQSGGATRLPCRPAGQRRLAGRLLIWQ